MQIGKLIISLGVVLVASFAIACAYAFHQWPDGQPIVHSSVDIDSPDRAWIATLETVDNGLGFGQGMLFDEVHIRRPNEALSEHGDSSKSAVFYVDAMGSAGDPPQVSWRDSRQLVITYDKRRSEANAPGKSVTNFHGIAIEYQLTPAK